MASENVRLAHAAEQRKQLKEDTAKFGDLFSAAYDEFIDIEDDVPVIFRKMMKDLWDSNFNQKVLQKNGTTRAAPPTDAEKLLRPKEYARCDHCEKVIQIRLMKLHQGRAICLETAKTRFTDVKLVKASKDKTEMPRVRVKERMALIAEYHDLSEKQVVKQIVEKLPMKNKQLERSIAMREQMLEEGDLTPEGIIRLEENKRQKLSEDFVVDSEEEDDEPPRVLTPIIEEVVAVLPVILPPPEVLKIKKKVVLKTLPKKLIINNE
jgi:hypothetical protein